MSRAKRKAAPVTSCTQLRHFKRTHSTMDMSTGAVSVGRVEYVTGPCNVPLFGTDQGKGLCRSCQKGWTHPDNRPATTEEAAAYETGAKS